MKHSIQKIAVIQHLRTLTCNITETSTYKKQVKFTSYLKLAILFPQCLSSSDTLKFISSWCKKSKQLLYLCASCKFDASSHFGLK
jgi:hypothetical protein